MYLQIDLADTPNRRKSKGFSRLALNKVAQPQTVWNFGEVSDVGLLVKEIRRIFEIGSVPGAKTYIKEA